MAADGPNVVDRELAASGPVAGVEADGGDRLAGPGRVLADFQPVLAKLVVGLDRQSWRLLQALTKRGLAPGPSRKMPEILV